MREREDAVWGWGWMALKASLFPAPSLMTLRVGHGSGAHRRKKTQKERSVSPDLSFADASISLAVYEVGKPVIAP